MIGLASASASKPMPCRYERAAARAGPSVSWRDWCLGSSCRPSMTAGPYPSAGSASCSAPARSARAHALALPAAQPPEVALDLARVDLAARQVQVRLGDDPALVALQRHPLREHVVGVGQARRAVRTRLVGELDAVLVQQPARLRQVGDDRLVRVDQVGVVDAAQVARTVGIRLAAPDAQEPEVAVHRPLLLVHARLQQLARALLGAALAAGVVRGAEIARAAALAPGATGLEAAVDPRHRDLPEQREDHDRGGRERDDHYAAPPAARGKKMTRPVSRGISSNARTISASRRPSERVVGTAAHMPVVELAAELLDQRLLLLGDLDVALGDELLAEAGTHAQELHRGRLYPSDLGVISMPGPPRGQAQDVDRARRRGRARAGRRAPRRRRSRAPPARPERRVAERQVRRQRRGVRAARAVRGAVGMALARDQVDAGRRRRARRSPRSRWPPVTTTTSGPSACSARASARRPSGAAGPGEHACLGQVRRDHGRARQQPATSALRALVVEQHRAGLGDHHGVDHDRRAAARAGRALRRPRRRSSARPEHARS